MMVDPILREYQCRFRKNRSVIVQIFSLKQIQDNSFYQNLDLHLVLVDFKQAYHTVNREELYKVMKDLKIQSNPYSKNYFKRY